MPTHSDNTQVAPELDRVSRNPSPLISVLWRRKLLGRLLSGFRFSPWTPWVWGWHHHHYAATASYTKWPRLMPKTAAGHAEAPSTGPGV